MHGIKYRKSEEMKESGIEWLGYIPEDWNVVRAKNQFVQSFKKGNKELVLLSATQNDGVVPKDTLEGVVQVKENADLNVFKTVHAGDYVISLRSFQGGFEMSSFEGVITPAYSVFRAKGQIVHKYFKRLFKSYGFVTKLNSLTVGIREGKNILFYDFANMQLPIPLIYDQQKIANFMEIKIAQFDSIISKKELLIIKLKEAKRSLISEVVTGKVKVVDGGIVPRHPEEMKDSGVEWLGMIPKDWRVKKLKFLVKLRNRKSNCITYSNYIGLENIEAQTGRYIENNSDESTVDGICNLIREHDVLFGKLRPYLAKCIVAEFNGFCSSEILVFKTKNILPELLKYSLLDNKFINLVNSSTYGAKMPRANWDFIGNIHLPFTDSGTQEEISAYLNDFSDKVEKTLTAIRKQIQKLKQAKITLISEAVAGKIDLRDWEIIEQGDLH